MENLSQSFIDDDSFIEKASDSLKLCSAIAEDNKWFPIAKCLEWKSFRNHPIDLSVILDYSQLFNIDSYLNDSDFRKRKRQELIASLKSKNSALTQEILLKKYSPKSQCYRNMLTLLKSHSLCLPTLSDGIEIKQSTQKNAGYGVFATRKIRKGEPLGFYGEFGFSNDEDSQLRNVKQPFVHYAFFCSAITTFCDDVNIQGYSAVVDAKYLTQESNGKKQFPNASWVQFINQAFDFNYLNCCFDTADYSPFICPEINEALIDPPIIRAIKDIEIGEELLVDYGYDYWKGHGRKAENVWSSRNVYKNEWTKVSDYWSVENKWNDFACESLKSIDQTMHKKFKKYVWE